MKRTYEELLEFLGLKVGDRVKVYKTIFEVRKNSLLDLEQPQRNGGFVFDVLIGHDYEILPPKKKVGELPFNSTNCNQYNLNILSALMSGHKTIYKALEFFKKSYNDDELYTILKARCDKELD